MTKMDLQHFAQMIHKELGIVYAEENFFQLEKRLVEAMRQGGYADERAFIDKARLGLDSRLKQSILDLATNNETSFFRDSKIFSTIESHVIPKIMQHDPNKNVIRIWCAASSFGQEPYSLAMTLTEMRKKNIMVPRFEMVATDISETALKRAQTAQYSQLEVGRGLPDDLKQKYFKAEATGFTLNPEIRFSVQFKKKNLLESFKDLGTFDLVLCRNVLIYQTNESKTKIVQHIADSMNENSFLFLGAAESLLGLTNDFDQRFDNGTIYFQRKAKVKAA